MADKGTPPEAPPRLLSKEQRQRIAEVLEERGASRPCPRCGKRSFSVVEGYFTHSLTAQVGSVVLGGPSIPVAVIACNNCGFLSEHALGMLGLLPSKEGEDR